MGNMIVFNYQGSNVTFKNKDGQVMVNANEMASKFGENKSPRYFLRLQSTEDYINHYVAVKNMHSVDNLIITQSGGIGGGGYTWLHEDIAIEFARWLSPEFSIWCNDRIKELMTIGMTALPKTIEDMITSPELVIRLATEIKELRAVRDISEKKIIEQMPKCDYYDAIISSKTTVDMSQVAKLINKKGVGRNNLFKILKDEKILRNNGEPYQKYIDLGYFKIIESKYDNKGKIMIGLKTVVYQKGVEFIKKILDRYE